MGSLPGLALAVVCMGTMAVGAVGLVAHLGVALFLRTPKAWKAVAGPVVCGLFGLIVMGATDRLGHERLTVLDDYCLLVPVVGVVLWVATSFVLTRD